MASLSVVLWLVRKIYGVGGLEVVACRGVRSDCIDQVKQQWLLCVEKASALTLINYAFLTTGCTRGLLVKFRLRREQCLYWVVFCSKLVLKSCSDERVSRL